MAKNSQQIPVNVQRQLVKQVDAAAAELVNLAKIDTMPAQLVSQAQQNYTAFDKSRTEFTEFGPKIRGSLSDYSKKYMGPGKEVGTPDPQNPINLETIDVGIKK